MKDRIGSIAKIIKDLTADEIAVCLKAIKIIHKLKYYLDREGEVDRNKIYNLIRQDADLVDLVARELGLIEVKRKTSKIAKRPGRAWVKKK